jgi:GNAT superfamily N-acetyltransferase
MVTPARPRIGPVTVTLIPANDLPAAYAALDRLADLARRTGAPSTPLLAQARTHAYRGSTVWTASVDGLPVAVRVARANRRPAKDWGPYLNSQLAYVLPAYRLGGVAKLLWNAALDLAHRTGCRRVKARAGSGSTSPPDTSSGGSSPPGSSSWTPHCRGPRTATRTGRPRRR